MATPPADNRGPEIQATRLETDDEIRQALEARRVRQVAKAPPVPLAAAASTPEPPAEPEVMPYRPLLRPPTALLCICDDGKPEGEWVRLRGDRYVLGRSEGDILIPHDGMMSGRHAELVRQRLPTGLTRWMLVDLQSRNGTFVRIGSTLLRHQSELLLGRGRYRFDAAGSLAPDQVPAATPAQGTVSWGNNPVAALVAALVELTPTGDGQRFPLGQSECWIGRDSKLCAIARPDDPFVSPRHARLFRDAKGQWHAENHKAPNGLWLRMEQVPIDGACQFQLGEQRFILRVSA